MGIKDDFVTWLADELKVHLLEHINAPKVKLKELTVGDVVETNDIVRFFVDGERDHYDPKQGVIGIKMTYYPEGALMLILDVSESRQAHALDLVNGKTGWIELSSLRLHT